MTIDTNELRRLAQAAMHPVTKGRWMRLFGERTIYDRMEDGCRGIPVVSTPFSPPHPFEAACLDFIAAANPTVILELLDRLEAAEKERDTLRTAVRHESDCVEAAKAEIKALRAKIEAMEQQVPICRAEDLRHAENLLPSLGLMPEDKLYAIPGAQPAPSIPEGWKLVPIEPTEEMTTAFARVFNVRDQSGTFTPAFRAALAAAPEAK